MSVETPLIQSDVLNCANGCLGVITLNRPRALNALNAEMAKSLFETLSKWAHDENLALVILRGAGPKSFCAGGDVRKTIETLGNSQVTAQRLKLATDYFKAEYRADYAIHRYPKPLLVWGHGLVLGGGWGLMAGASHRVVTPSSQLAMPEILIGLFPDVAASWFLNRLPSGLGLFLAMTASRVGPEDALAYGLAEHLLPENGCDALIDHLRTLHWWANPGQNSQQLHQSLRDHGISGSMEPQPLQKHRETLEKLHQSGTLKAFAQGLDTTPCDDPWLARAKAQFHQGSPTSIEATYRLMDHTRHFSLKQCFELDARLMMIFCQHPDFQEGIRAMLIEKDQKPKWQAKNLKEVDHAWINSLFADRSEDPTSLVSFLD